MKIPIRLLYVLLCGTLLCSCIDSEQFAKYSFNQESSASSAANFETLAEDWSNFGDIHYSASMMFGIGANYTKEGMMKPLQCDYCRTDNASLNFYAKSMFSIEDYDISGDYYLTFFVSVNGELVDFLVNSEPSKNGILQTQVPIGELTSYKFTISNASFYKGENELAVYCIAYLPQVGNYFCALDAGMFFAENKTVGDCTSYAIRDEILGVTTDTINGKNEDEISEVIKGTRLMVDSDNILGTDNKAKCSEITQNTPMSFSYINSTNNKDRTGFCIALRNGQPLSVWNNNVLLSLNINKEELVLHIPMNTELPMNDYSYMGVMFFEMPDISSNTLPEIYMQRELYYIKG